MLGWGNYGVTDMNQPTLSASFIKSVDRPGRYPDAAARGLSLLVKGTSAGWVSKSWSVRIRTSTVDTRKGLGSYPRVGLAEARSKAADKWAEARTSTPVVRRRASRRVPTFADAAEHVIGRRKPSTARKLRSILQRAFEAFGSRPVNAITTASLLDLLDPLTRTRPETAKQLRQQVAEVMLYSIGRGWRADNPAGDVLMAALPKPGRKVEHRKALPHSQVAAAIATVRQSTLSAAARAAFEFQVLTAARPGEVREMSWGEVDGSVWTIPGTRMKAGKTHTVPLSPQAVAVLEGARKLTRAGSGGWVFPTTKGKPLGDTTLIAGLKRLGIAASPHGFRSSFRDWCGEAGVDRELAERSLAHEFGTATERAYARTDLLERRRSLMADWADHVSR